MDLIDGLNSLAVVITEKMEVPATRDMSDVPALIAQNGGCIFIGIPVHVQRLMSGANLEVPVTMTASAPSNLQSADWLLSRMDAFVQLIGSKSVISTSLEVGDMSFPAISAVLQITLEAKQ